MANDYQDAKAKADAMFVYFSEILKKEVLDAERKLVGGVWDISVKSGEVYPKADRLIIRRGWRRRLTASVGWSCVTGFDDEILLSVPSRDLRFEPQVKEYEFLLRRDILDQQVVDTYNHKVRRVNDVHLLKVDHELMVAHVDTGLRGLVRRLDWQRPVDFCVRAIAKDASYLKKEELVSWKYVQPVAINPASMTMRLTMTQKQLNSIPPADLGEIIFDLNPTERMALFRALDVKTKARIFESLEIENQKAILGDLDKKEAALIVTHMSSDNAADLLEKLPHDTVRNLLTLIETNMAKKLSGLLGYSSDSAGGLMTTEYVTMAETMTVASAIDFIKHQTHDFESLHHIYIVDDKNHLKGMSTVRRLLIADPRETVLSTVFPKTVCVHLNDSVKEVAYVMDKYRVSAIPVVDENRVLHGVITMDDILSKVISIAWRKRSRASKGI